MPEGGGGPWGAPYRKLSPGPGKAPQEVATHQRARLHSAMIQVAAERGYSDATVRELASLAGVSTRAFYEHFSGKEECFLRAYELAVRRAAKRIIESQKGERDWQRRLLRAFSAFAQEIEREPQAARIALVEAFAAGPAALARMRHAEEAFERMIGQSFSHPPDGVEMPPLILRGIVSGVARVTRAQLLSGREGELSGLAGELMEWALSFRWRNIKVLGWLDRRPLEGGGAPGPGPAGNAERTGEQDPVNDRALILSAIGKLAVTDGYEALTVPRIRAAAGVSRRTFDSHFGGIDDCFLAALELGVGGALERAVRAHAAGGTWPGGVYRAVSALCEHVAQDPVLANLAFVDAFAPGPAAVIRRSQLIDQTADLLRESAPPGQRPEKLAAQASVGAVWGVIHHHTVTGRTAQLPRVAATLSFLALAPAIGAPATVQTIRQEQVE